MPVDISSEEETAEIYSLETSLKWENEDFNMCAIIYQGLSREVVQRIFEEALRIRNTTGFGQRKITRLVNKKFDIKFSENTIADWLYSANVPFAQEKTQFKPMKKPSKEKLLALYQKGFSTTEVGNVFGVTFWTAKNWLNSYGIKTRNHSESMNTDKIKMTLRDKKLLVPLKGLNEMSAEKAYIFGVLCGDGFISKRNVKLEIRRDREFVKKFVDCLNAVYDTDVGYRYYPPRNSFIADIAREIICLDLMRNNSFGTFDWRVPESVMFTKNTHYITNFLQGYFDSEGHVGKYIVNVSSKNFYGLKQVQTLLSKLDVKSNFSSSKIVLSISGKKNLEKFKKLINFTIQRKAEKLESFYGGKW